jgi:solute carrier family 25 protein 44
MHKPTYYSCGVALFTASNIAAQPSFLVKKRRQIDGSSFRDIVRSEGLRGLFRGAVISWIPGCSRMLYFSVFEAVKALCAGRGHSKPFSEGAAGAVGSLFGQAVLVPYSIVATRLQLSRGVPLSVSSVVRRIHSSHGGQLRVWWSTYPNALMQLVPANAIMWSVFAYTRERAVVWEGCEDDPSRLSLGSSLACSSTASLTSMIFTSPLDSIRTHKEALLVGHAGDSLAGRQTSWFVCKHIYRTQGVPGFFRGMAARATAISPPLIAMMVGYQYVKEVSCWVNLNLGYGAKSDLPRHSPLVIR